MGRRNPRGRRLHGILLLDKATGCSSNHALQRIKRLYDAQKAGHTGSLDPLATGMLPICFGEATKVSPFLLDADKTYETDARLGVRTNSGDADGEVIASAAVPDQLSLASVSETVQSFAGSIAQIPPMYSAIKINGQRLYKLARKGISVDRQARNVTIHSIEVLHWQRDLLRLRVRCSKGTYIRTLVEDIGAALSCGAHVETLRRISVTPFESDAMETERGLAEAFEDGGQSLLDERLLPTDVALQHLPVAQLDAVEHSLFCQGQAVSVSASECLPAAGTQLRVYAEGQLLGIGKSLYNEEHNGKIQPFRVFNW